jgi:ubiquinone/menaquinone biosynthesis C-methylase UbiE
MPFADDSFDGVVGDGSFTLLEYPLQYRQLFSHLERVMKPGGLLIVRIFAAPETGETCAMACSDAMHGKIQGFHAFKWRLSMAMTSEACNPNLRVADTHEMFNHLLPDRERLARASGWSMEDISTIDFYQGSSARYSYPTLTQFRHIIPPGFRETGLIRGTYELAERCPILALELAQ